MKKSSKPSEGAIVNDESDKISQLPDEILHYILSFVNITHVVRSSVLSRRWKPLWVTMPYLEFDNDLFPFKYYQEYEELISWVLMSQGSTNITRFSLMWEHNLYKDKLTRWIHILMRRNVKELDLKYFCEEIETLPSCLFTCESLQVLKLRLPCSVLQLPNRLNLRRLTSLTLEEIEFTDEKSIARLVRECSSLEDLSLNSCIMTSIKVVNISSSSLKCLKVSDEPLSDEKYHYSECEFRISCPNLLSLTCLYVEARIFRLENISSLENMKMDTLKEDLCFAIDEESTMFYRLKLLTLSIRIAKPFVQKMFLLLKHCLNVESLIIDSEWTFITKTFTDENEAWQLNDEGHWGNYLKSVQLSNFTGTKNEVEFVKFMLKNGFALQKFIVIWSNKWKCKTRVTDESILNIHKSSSLVEVKVIHLKTETY